MNISRIVRYAYVGIHGYDGGYENDSPQADYVYNNKNGDLYINDPFPSPDDAFLLYVPKHSVEYILDRVDELSTEEWKDYNCDEPCENPPTISITSVGEWADTSNDPFVVPIGYEVSEGAEVVISGVTPTSAAQNVRFYPAVNGVIVEWTGNGFPEDFELSIIAEAEDGNCISEPATASVTIDPAIRVVNKTNPGTIDYDNVHRPFTGENYLANGSSLNMHAYTTPEDVEVDWTAYGDTITVSVDDDTHYATVNGVSDGNASLIVSFVYEGQTYSYSIAIIVGAPD